jgi:chromosome segregation ATPase
VVELLESVKKFFSNRTETVELGEVTDFYREEKESEIKEAERKAEELMDQTDNLLEELDEGIEELKGYEHDKGIQAVEDVADNFYSSRKRMIERFDSPDGIEEHVEEFADFAEEFNDVSRKEGEVLKFIEKQSGKLPQTIEKLVSHREELEEFLENEYTAVSNLEEIRERLGDISDRRKELSELRDRIDESEIKDLKERKDELEGRMEKVEQSQEWQEKTRKEEKIEELEQDKQDIISELSRQVSRIERPVKKMLYSIENEDVGFEADEDKLRKLMDREFHEIEGLGPVLKETEKVLKEEDIADRDKRKKFLKAKAELSQLEERKHEVGELEEEISQLQKSLDKMDVQEKRNDLQKQAQELRQKIERKEEQLEERKTEADRLVGEIEDLEQQIQSVLNKAFGFDVKLD